MSAIYIVLISMVCVHVFWTFWIYRRLVVQEKAINLFLATSLRHVDPVAYEKFAGRDGEVISIPRR
jgi:hypothetical protein